MSLVSLVAETYDAFNRYAGDAQVVLLHPSSRLRSMLVAHLLNEAPRPVFYYAMGADDVNLPAFLDGFSHDISVQKPTFGRHLYRVWHTNKIDFEVLVEAFINDLAELHEDPYILIIDEFDASREADDVQSFWERVVRFLPAKCQLVLNSRMMPRMPWVSLMAQGQAVVLQDTRNVSHNFYRDAPEESLASLSAVGLGPGFVHKDDELIEEWEGHLPRLLFFFVLSRPLVTRSEICSTFWPTLDSDQAVNVFHVTKRRLHKALGFDVLVHKDGYYHINPEIHVDYDVENFVSALIKGRQAPDARSGLEHWQMAAELYRGPFLQGHTDEWIAEQRQNLQSGYLEAITSIARARIEEGRKEQALSLLLRAAGENNIYEPIHCEIMKLYANLGRRSEAAGHYQKLIEVMGNQGEEPGPELQAVYHQIMS